ncbi:bifunctional tryptophan synthase TRP1 [Pholiota molesta]|nr:bifunctional tryptophan synthase TRP1 [Pholiota molesta]
MEGLKQVFQKKHAEAWVPAFVTFVTAGYPREQILSGYYELGMPFSDPMRMDPSSRRRTLYIALQTKEARNRMQAPVLSWVHLCYYNPLLSYGEDKAIQDAARLEAITFREKCTKAKLSYVPLIAPSTTLARIHSSHPLPILLLCRFKSKHPNSDQMGTTGSSVQGQMNTALPNIIARIRQFTEIPLAVGFGVATRAHFETAYCREISMKGDPSRVVRLQRLASLAHTQKPSATYIRGQYVPEALVDCLAELEAAHKSAMADPKFHEELRSHFGYIIREDLNHTGSHKINNAIGQILLARRLGKTRIIAETGADNTFGMECVIYMGSEDVRRQALNVFRIEMLGAKVTYFYSPEAMHAVNEAFRDWVPTYRPRTISWICHRTPSFPTLVRDFQKVIGEEIKQQIQAARGKLPDVVVACVGGGSNAIGTFYDFIGDKNVRLVGVEAGGEGIDGDRHSATLSMGQPGVLHGVRTYVLQSKTGQIIETHSISAGWITCGRAEYVVATDEEALRGFRILTQREELFLSSHAIWEAMKIAKTLPKDQDIVVCLSGRDSQVLPKWAERLDWHVPHAGL